MAELVREANILVYGKTEDKALLTLKKTAEEKTRRIISLFAVGAE